MIEGLYSILDCLCEQDGGVANMVANFVRGIDKYRDAPIVASKMASLNELMDKYSPILAGLKLDLRKVTKNTIC